MPVDLTPLAGKRGSFTTRAVVGWPVGDISLGATSVAYEITREGKIKILSIRNQGSEISGMLNEAILGDFRDRALRHAAQELERIRQRESKDAD